MNKVLLRLIYIVLILCMIAGCNPGNANGKVVAKNDNKIASLQLLLPNQSATKAEAHAVFLKIRFDPEYIRTLDRFYNLEYPSDSSILFIRDNKAFFPSYVQYINSGRSDEFHYFIGINDLDDSKLYLNTRFGITAIDTLFTPINF